MNSRKSMECNAKTHQGVRLASMIGLLLLSGLFSKAFATNGTSAETVTVTQQQSKTITGKVVDAQNVPVIGASVMIKGKAIGVATDANGGFKLEVSSGSVLVVSAVGYVKQEVSVGSKKTFTVVLQEDTKLLGEVVVVGYGTQKKADLTGSVSAVTGKELADRPAVNTATMLEAQVPGLRVITGVGQPGAENVSFRIRGQGTFSSAGSDPLILVNGVPADITHLDPSVIESVSVLKDAASAAIYGARAANGVILVTTKEGTVGDGKAHLTYNGNIGIYSVTRMYDLVTNSVEFMELANTAKKNSLSNTIYTDEMINNYKNNPNSDEYPSFDWLGYMFRTVVAQKHNLTLSGNSGKSTYNISLNYVNQPGALRGFKYEQYNTTIDLTARPTSFMKVGSYTSMVYGERTQPRVGQNDVFLSAMAQAPTYRPWLPDDGTGVTKYVYSAYAGEAHNKNIPAYIGSGAMKRFKNYDINTQLWADVTLAKGLNWYTKAAVRLQDTKAKDWRPTGVPLYNYHTKLQYTLMDAGGSGLSVDDDRDVYYNFYTYLKYQFTSADKAHNFSIMGGYNAEKEKDETLGAYRQSYAFPLETISAGATTNWSNYGTETDWALMSYFGRLNYNYKDRYLLEANIRYDGSSRFAQGNRWGAFPSFSAAWRPTEEKFVKNLNLSWLNDLKVRASWGQLGNQNIGYYPYQQVISHVSDYAFNKSTVTSAYTVAQYANRNIKWEKTTVTDFGADFQLFDGLNVTFDWYNKRTTDILRSSQVSVLLGLGAPTVNNGTVENKGIEISATYNKMVRNGVFKGLRYSVGGYFDRTRNKLTKFGAQEIGDYFLRREGLPYNTFYVLKAIGIFKDEAEVNASPKQFSDNTLPGDIKYMDADGNGKIDENDRVPIDGQFPGFEYGVNANASWKGFDFSFLGQGVANKKFYTEYWGVQPFFQGSAPTKQYLKDMWTEDHTDAKAPRLYYQNLGGSKNSRRNSWFLKDASYFRIKNITIGYTLPESLTSKVRLSKVRVYFSGDNLLTITKFQGLDPERDVTDNYGNGRDCQYPQNKVYSFGINVEF
jgi:TonB-linked SusC/RagA family outer membrane protein